MKECLNTKAHGCNIFNLFSNANLIYFPHVCCVNLAYMLLDSLVTNMNFIDDFLVALMSLYV